MSILKRAADAVYAFRFLRLLVMPWKKTKAYELGLIDDNGRLIKSAETSQEKSAYTYFHRLIFNLKRLINLVPGKGARTLASYASALYLIKEYTNQSEEKLLESLKFENNSLTENLEETGLIENRRYQLNKDIIIQSENFDLVAKNGSIITVKEAKDKFSGITVYEAIHNLTNKKIYVTEHDILTDLNQEEFSVTTADVSMPPMPMKSDYGDKYQHFKIPSTVFCKFDRGRKKYQRWKVYLDLNDQKQLQIAQFARKYRGALIVIEDEYTGAMRAIRPTSSDGR
jgi:hypothetical protein